MKITEAKLEAMVTRKEDYPPADLTEIALVGRSNVGKSSLINALCRRKKLAYTSSSPGKTRTINFYQINGAFRLVDLPGYGYARASKKDRADWARFINDYLAERENLVEVWLLVDLRHEPSKLDQEMYAWILDGGFSGTVIATKADKLSHNKRDQGIRLIRQGLAMYGEALLLPFSAEKGIGRDRLEEVLFHQLRGQENRKEANA